MPMPGSLKAVAEERGEESVIEMVVKAIEEEGGINPAARKLRVRANSIRHQLEYNGLIVVTKQIAKVVKVEELI